MDIDTKFWGVEFRGAWAGVTLEPWSLDRQHTFMLWLSKAFGPDVISTLITLGPSLRVSGPDRWQFIQVALMERADALKDGINRVLSSAGAGSGDMLGWLLSGACATQAPESTPSTPTPGTVAWGNATGTPDFAGVGASGAGAMNVSCLKIPLWEVGVPREQAAFNKILRGVFDLYKLVGAIILENLFPLDSGQQVSRQLRPEKLAMMQHVLTALRVDTAAVPRGE